MLVDGFSCMHVLMAHKPPSPIEFLTPWDLEKMSLGSPQIIFLSCNTDIGHTPPPPGLPFAKPQTCYY